MRELARLIQGEFIKMRHTKLLWMHIFVPAAGAAVFLLYYGYAPWSAEGKVQGYMESVAVAYPFLAGLVCAMSVELEEEGHMQTFLLSGRRKYRLFLGKWLALGLCSLAASAIAFPGFAAGYEFILRQNPYPAHFYILGWLALWGGQMVLYAFHLFLSLCFGKAASMAAGIVEAVLAALMLTGLGDGCWPVVPCAWSGRWSSYLLLYEAGDRGRWSAAARSLPAQLAVCAAAAVLITAGIFIWFHYYEGRQCEE